MKPTLIGGLVALGISTHNTAFAEDRAAWIASSQNSDTVTLQAHAHLKEGESGRYNLMVKKSGQSGTSTTRQAGRIPAGDGLPAVGPLMTSRLSFRRGETLTADLVVETSTGREIRDVVTLSNDP